jgi:hypothetical protein
VARFVQSWDELKKLLEEKLPGEKIYKVYYQIQNTAKQYKISDANDFNDMPAGSVAEPILIIPKFEST